MKKLTCKDLGGVCDEEFEGNSFEEIGQKSHAHVIKKINEGDEAHKQAAEDMKNLTPEEQTKKIEEFKEKYNKINS